MEVVAVNAGGSWEKKYLHGREYLSVPMTLIVPGVLSGSRGPLYYPPEEIEASAEAWNHMPLVAYHPYKNGQPVSARSPAVLNAQWLGFVFNSRYQDRLLADGWFDLQATRAFDAKLPEQFRILPRLHRAEPIELSTGLYTANEAAPAGSAHNGRPYDWVARRYRPDHLAVLPDQTGACSISDGCGVLINLKLTPADKGAEVDKTQLVSWLTTNCDCWKRQGDADVLNSMSVEKLSSLKDHEEKEANARKVAEAAKKGFGEATFNAMVTNADPMQVMMAACKQLLTPAPSPPSPPSPPSGGGNPPSHPPANNAAASAQPPVPVAQPLTEQQWLESAPPGVRAVVQNALAREQAERKAVIDRIVGNVAQVEQASTRQWLESKPLAELTQMEKLAKPPQPVQNALPHWLGAAAPSSATAPAGQTANADDDLLVSPVINWAEEYEEEEQRRSKRRAATADE